MIQHIIPMQYKTSKNKNKKEKFNKTREWLERIFITFLVKQKGRNQSNYWKKRFDKNPIPTVDEIIKKQGDRQRRKGMAQCGTYAIL